MNAAVAAAVILFSCSFTLNPDGSGKVVVEVRQPTEPTAGFGDANPPTPEMARKAALAVIRGAKGVDTWAEVAVGVSPDGLMTFKGTAYFSDIGRVLVSAYHAGVIPATWTQDPKGGMVFSIDPLPGRPPNPVQLTPEELAKQVEKAREDWKQTRSAAGNLARFTHDMAYRLPGEPAEVTGFKKGPEGAFHFTYDGSKVLPAFDQLMADDKYVSGAILAGFDPASPGCPLFHEKYFGAKSWTARVEGLMKPQFDYAAEVKAAQEAAPKMMEKLGLSVEPVKPVPPAPRQP